APPGRCAGWWKWMARSSPGPMPRERRPRRRRPATKTPSCRKRQRREVDVAFFLHRDLFVGPPKRDLTIRGRPLPAAGGARQRLQLRRLLHQLGNQFEGLFERGITA